MAVENKWAVDQNESGYYPQTAYKKNPQDLKVIRAKIEVAAADDDGSVYGLGIVRGTDLIKNIQVANDAITGGTDYDIGLYEIGSDELIGTVVDKDLFLDGGSLATGHAVGSELSGISAVALADSDKDINELLSKTDGATRYALVLTANTVGTAAGTVVVTVEVVNA